MRELQAVNYDAGLYKDENLLYRNKLLEPSQLDTSLTYIFGKDSNLFPLLTLTKGSGNMFGIKPKQLNGDTQYWWPIMGRTKHISRCLGLVNSANVTLPGVAFSSFQVDFEDRMLIPQYGAISPDSLHYVRVQGEPQEIAPSRFRYTFVIVGSDRTEYIPVANFTAGQAWVMSAPTIPASKSDGNRFNSMTPGRLTNQFSFHRYSYAIAGNIANKVTPIEFDIEGGGKTKMWIPFDMKRFEMERMFMDEQSLWFSKYNRDANGQITTIDPDTNEPVPMGAGVQEILTNSGQYDTASALTLGKFDAILDKISSNNPDFQTTDIVVYTGAGGKRLFHQTVFADAISKGFLFQLSAEEIKADQSGLTYGSYFNRYKTIDGRYVSIVETNLFNHGSIAESQRANGNTYKGFPLISYTMVFLDHSTTKDGRRNIELVAEEGREYITGVYKGMSPLPSVWNALPSGNVISTRRDVAFYEVINSMGICIKNPYSSFWLDFTL